MADRRSNYGNEKQKRDRQIVQGTVSAAMNYVKGKAPNTEKRMARINATGNNPIGGRRVEAVQRRESTEETLRRKFEEARKN